MSDRREELPFDARLLHSAVIEMNISRRTASVYHKDHILVVSAIDRIYGFLLKLLELRPEITLAVAKDTLIVDDYYFDRKNPVYREFALHLNSLNIAHLTFVSGLTKDELYRFHEFLSPKTADLSPESVERFYGDMNLLHIRIGFINYRAFALTMNNDDLEKTERYLWERYTQGLLDGRLSVKEVSGTLYEVPPSVLAQIFNDVPAGTLREESYDHVIAAYLRRSSESVLADSDLKRLIEFITDLKPELKKQFLSSAVNNMNTNIGHLAPALRELPSEMIIEVLHTANEQNVVIPQALKNILDKLSYLPYSEACEGLSYDSYITDDIAFSKDTMDFFRGSNFDAYVSPAYRSEIERLLRYDITQGSKINFDELIEECSSENHENLFNRVALELIMTCSIPPEETGYFVNLLTAQAEHLIESGRYNLLLRTLTHLFNVLQKGAYPQIVEEVVGHLKTPDIIIRLVGSFKNYGRQMRDEVLLLCSYYGKDILPYLFKALIDEESQTMRSFIINLITQFGERAVPEALRHLADHRWYVKRNMLYIINQCGGLGFDISQEVRTCSVHENYKVRLEAIKLLVRKGDKKGIDALRESLKSQDFRIVRDAVTVAGSLCVQELVTDLLPMLQKKKPAGSDISVKRAIVRTLGQIADRRALAVFRSIVGAKGTIPKDTDEPLIRDIFQTLANFSPEDAEDIINIGLKSDNNTLREAAGALMRHFGADNGRR